jgi:hypothetical protein
MLKINRQGRDKVRPRNLSYDLTTDAVELFVDFESFSDIFANPDSLPSYKPVGMLFMIGVGRVVGGKWEQTQFVAESATREAEEEVMRSFVEYVGRCGSNPRLYCWHAEERFWKSAERRQFDLASIRGDEEVKDEISDGWKMEGWFDLCQFFKDERIVIKGCLKYGLKAVAKALREHGLISAAITSKCDSGMAAQVRAWQAYQSGEDMTRNSTMSDIAEYNTFDCKVLYEIVEYLRENHPCLPE